MWQIQLTGPLPTLRMGRVVELLVIVIRWCNGISTARLVGLAVVSVGMRATITHRAARRKRSTGHGRGGLTKVHGTALVRRAPWIRPATRDGCGEGQRPEGMGWRLVSERECTRIDHAEGEGV